MDTTHWEELKQFVKSEIEEANKLADMKKAPNLYAYNEACGQSYALRRVLAAMALMELKAI